MLQDDDVGEEDGDVVNHRPVLLCKVRYIEHLLNIV
jgi:hypothetical protein